ncbi:hypothetical protein Desde_3848 [Desulfitobacterium dehalogenans ATCC 51507]|uniref:TolC family protein n=1 Tax=Desulfitobacterium dehalogenans (strain ATCC 51507 / DSM 9161 / JW/IU-DC1) TaxID=756499 RepID=I4ADT0_DESDJ|nr:TolC family protein [Desulfitobacterium dehalogenans]AFM02115.1 hypothetical protein Desde_3848 [Desulfitobacterium dehalogenans ATCC 51507]
MKKVIASIALVTLVLASTTQVAFAAAEESLNIEKAAIKAVENSQPLKTVNQQAEVIQKNYVSVKGQMNQTKYLLPYSNSYSLVKAIILYPLQLKSALEQVNNTQVVVTNAIRMGAYSGYIELLKADYALNTQSELMNSLYEDYKKARLQKEQSMLTDAQLRLAEIAYEQTRYNYLNAQNSKDSAKMALNNMMKEDIAKQYAVLQDNNIKPSAQVRALDDYVQQARTNRAEVLNAQSTLDILEEQYRLGIAEIPTDYEFYKQQQEYEIAKAGNDLELARISVQQNVTDLYAGLESSMKKMEAMSYLADQAEQNYQAAQIRYENSEITFIELNKIKVAKAQADINLKNAELDAWLMQAMMESACGAGFQP